MDKEKKDELLSIKGVVDVINIMSGCIVVVVNDVFWETHAIRVKRVPDHVDGVTTRIIDEGSEWDCILRPQGRHVIG